MSAIPFEKLDRIIQRFATAEHELSSGAASGEAFARLSREYAELEPTARAAQGLRKCYDERRDLQEMVAAGGEMAEMAASELPDLDEDSPERG